MACCSGCRCSRSGARPSTVSIVWPSACAANIRQERTGTPSKITVQAPQTPCSQPTWVPASKRSCRRKSLSSNRASTLRRYGVPFTVTLISWVSVATPRPFVGRVERACGQHAREVTLKFLAGMDAAARIDRALHQRRRRLDLLCADLPAGERLACFRRKYRPVAGIAETDPRLGTAARFVDAHRAGHADEGKIAASARHFQKTGAGARLCNR